MKPDCIDGSVPSRILVRGTNWVGDTVMSLPALRELRRIFEDSVIALWVPSGLADLIRASGIADEIISFDRNSHGPLVRPFKMRGKLAGGKFDMAVFLQNAFEGPFTAFMARIPLRAGYPTDLRGPLLNIRIPLTAEIKSKHQVFYYLGIADFLGSRFDGGHAASGGIPDCSILMGMDSLSRGRDLLISNGADMKRPIFCLCPGSVNSEAKRWPGENFAVLADLLADRMNSRIVFLGSPGERSLIEEIRSAMKNTLSINLAGQGDMMTSMAAMYFSRMVISNDTGSAHLAVAASARVLTLFGPTVAGATAPFGPEAYVMEGTASCAPCRNFLCPVKGHPCMMSLKPEAVFDRIEGILSRGSTRVRLTGRRG